MVDARAIGAGQADRQHPAHGMSHQVEAVDMKTVEQGDRGARHRVEAIGKSGLRRFAKADLIRGDDPVARLGQRLDRRRPIAGGKVSPVQEHDCPPRRRAGWGYIHVSEAQILAFEGKGQELDRIRVGKSLERDAHRVVGRRWRCGSARPKGRRDRKTKGNSAAKRHRRSSRSLVAISEWTVIRQHYKLAAVASPLRAAHRCSGSAGQVRKTALRGYDDLRRGKAR